MPKPADSNSPAESLSSERYRHDWNSAGAWAGRLAFPMIVVGVLLGMRAAKALQPPDRDETTGYLFVAGCMVAVGVGLWLLRVRHRHLRNIGRGEKL